MPGYFDKPVHWRLRADMTRTIAEGMRNAEARRILYSVATEYDTMAQRLEQDRATPAARPQQVNGHDDLRSQLDDLQRKYNSR